MDWDIQDVKLKTENSAPNDDAAHAQHAQKDVKEFPLTSVRMSRTGLQLSESNNNKL